MSRIALLAAVAATLCLQGCVSTVVGTAVGVTAAAVGVTAKGVGAVGRAVIPGGHDDKEKDR